MRPVFSVLARMKGLRGAWVDPFSYHPERRMERDLLAWYQALLTRAATEAPADLPRWREILAAPMNIRGYGPVKAEAAHRVREAVAAQLG